MAIRFKCGKCSHSLQVSDEHAGQKAKCPNCGAVLPVPIAGKSGPVAKTSGKPAIPSGRGALGPSVGGPIPSLSTRKKPGKAKGPSKKAQPLKGSGPARPLRSGTKPVIFGAAVVAVLVLALVGWQMGWFGSQEQSPAPEPDFLTRAEPRVRTKPKPPIVAKPIITVAMLREEADKLELQLADLERFLVVEPTGAKVNERLVEGHKGLELLNVQLQSQSAVAKNTFPLLEANKKWLYEKILVRAETLVGQYRFSSAKKLLEEVLPAGAISDKYTSSTASGQRGVGNTNWQAAQRACRDFANSKLIRRGVQGQLCIWQSEETDEQGQANTLISLDEPQNTGVAYRGRQSQPKWQKKWGAASEHLAFIGKLQEQAEERQDIGRAGRLYAIIREFQNRCITFDTPSKADSELMNQLARKKADYEAHERIRGLIGRCRYEQALELAQELVEQNPGNPANYHWLLRCYLESYNAIPLQMEASLLVSQAAKMTELAEYDLPNSLLALGLSWLSAPKELGALRNEEFSEDLSSQLESLGAYAGRYEALIDWLKGESKEMVLGDFRYNPFLSGEPVELLDSQGTLYRFYVRKGPSGRACVIVTRGRPDQEQQGLSVYLSDSRSYQLWNVYPSDESSNLGEFSRPVLSKPRFQAVLELGQINSSRVVGQTTIPAVSSLSSLRSEQSANGWRLRIPRGTMDRAQRGPDPPRTTRRPPRSTAGAGADDSDRFVWIGFSPSGAGRTSNYASTGSSGYRPITCLVRTSASKMAYFSDEKGKYLLGLGGRRLYATRKGLLQTLDGAGPQWCLALDARAYPPELGEEIDESAYSPTPSPTPAPTSGRRMTRRERTLAMMLAHGVGQTTSPSPGASVPTRSTARAVPTRLGPFSVAEAASWLSRLADQNVRYNTGSAAVVGRWLDSQGSIIVHAKGQMRELGGGDYFEPMFYSSDVAMNLIKEADAFYEKSLRAWPTLAGEVYRRVNKSRLSRLVDIGKPSVGYSAGARGLEGVDVEAFSGRAEALLGVGDYNQAIAIYNDLIGILSLRVQQGLAKDVLPSGGRRLLGAESPSGYSQPGLNSETLSPEDRFFIDADLLIKSCVGKAVALREAGMPVQARGSLGRMVGRLRAYLLVELSEFIHYRKDRGMDVSGELVEIRDRWQGVLGGEIEPGLSLALQVARGQATGKKASMSLAQWLAADAAELSAIAPERLMVEAQFSWVRGSLDLERAESSESATASERADRIIALAQAYHSSSQASAEAAEAIWQLGSFMAVVGYEAEAWDCLSQAAAIYSELGLAILSEFADSEGGSEEAEQRYYAYRTAALAAMGEGVLLSADVPAAKKCSAMLAAELLGKFSQLRRAWSDSAGGPEQPGILRTSGSALRFVQELSEAKAYAEPRMRFWWWYYRPDVAGSLVVAKTSRPKIEYVESEKSPGKQELP